MKKKYHIQDKPFVVPTTDGKIIEEHFGNATDTNSQISIAHMVAPPKWSEPFQTPEFDEYTYIIKGKKQFIIDDEINFNSVLDIYSNSDLSYGHNTRITNEKLERLTIRLKSIFKLKNKPIIKNKSKVDKRQKVILLSDEFRSITKNIKIKP